MFPEERNYTNGGIFSMFDKKISITQLLFKMQDFIKDTGYLSSCPISFNKHRLVF